MFLFLNGRNIKFCNHPNPNYAFKMLFRLSTFISNMAFIPSFVSSSFSSSGQGESQPQCSYKIVLIKKRVYNSPFMTSHVRNSPFLHNSPLFVTLHLSGLDHVRYTRLLRRNLKSSPVECPFGK